MFGPSSYNGLRFRCLQFLFMFGPPSRNRLQLRCIRFLFRKLVGLGLFRCVFPPEHIAFLLVAFLRLFRAGSERRDRSGRSKGSFRFRYE
jgi:hypothetical protein